MIRILIEEMPNDQDMQKTVMLGAIHVLEVGDPQNGSLENIVQFYKPETPIMELQQNPEMVGAPHVTSVPMGEPGESWIRKTQRVINKIATLGI